MSRLDGWMAQKLGILPEQLDRSVIEQQQLTELNKLLQWCRSRSTYYRDYPEQLQSLSELTTLPFLTGTDLVEHGQQLVCVSQSEISRVVTMQTSGTSGRSKRLFFSQADQQLTIDFFACGLSELNHTGDRCMILMPGNRPGGMSHLIQQALLQIRVVPVPCGNDVSFAHMARLLAVHRVSTMVGSPVQILSLARYLQHYQLPHSIKAVLVSSDYLPESVRRAIADTLHCAVYDHYGITEGGLGFSIECEQHQGLHIRENDLLVEIINPDTGMPVADGQWGELVFTTLTRRAMPLIRYRTGDKVRLLATPCACGSVVKRMDKIGGRLAQLAESYTITELDERIFQLPSVVDYQVHYQKAQHQLTLYVLLTEPLSQWKDAIETLLQPVLQQGDTLLVEGEMLPEQQTEIGSFYQAKRKIMVE